jgi:ABC-type multidrug transport system fused ATPase/permease subunit
MTVIGAVIEGARGRQGTSLGRVRGSRAALAACAGTLAAACSVGLLGLSGWLISHAAQRPMVLSLMAPAAVVQACGLGRAVLRYAERLRGHDAALDQLARIRGRVYESLIPLAPAGLADFRSGDLVARLVGDIDSLADRWLRVRCRRRHRGGAARRRGRSRGQPGGRRRRRSGDRHRDLPPGGALGRPVARRGGRHRR